MYTWFEDFFLVKLYLLQNELPEDLTRYVLSQFYVPIMHAAYEEIIVDSHYQKLGNAGPTGFKTTDTDSMIRLLQNPYLLLDSRIPNTRVEKCMVMLTHLFGKFCIVPYSAIGLLLKALESNNFQAFHLLYQYDLLKYLSVDLVDEIVERLVLYIDRKERWPYKLYSNSISFIKFLLLHDREEEKLLKWMTIHPKMGYDIVKHAIEEKCGVKLKEKYKALLEKQRSPEMRQTRIHFLLHGIYQR